MGRGLQGVRVGQRVWVNGQYASDRCIQTVVRLTPSQIITDWSWGDKIKRFQRGKKSRYTDDLNYYEIGSYGFSRRELDRIATKSECEQYDLEQAQNREVAAKELEARQRKANKQEELRALFGARRVSLGEAYHVNGAEWKVDLYLTEAGVHRLVEIISTFPLEELGEWEKVA